MLSIALLLPAFYFYHTQKLELEKSTEQLAKQLIISLRTSISKSILFEEYFEVWQLINIQLKNNQQQINTGGLFKISEIAILDKNNHVFAHSSPATHPLKKQYTGITPTHKILPINSDKIIITTPKDNINTCIRLYANAIYQGNSDGLIILQLDLSLFDKLNHQLIVNFILYFIFIIILILITGILFGDWISRPLKIIEESLTKIGSGELQIKELHRRYDEYQKLALAIEKTDKELYNSHSKIDALLDTTKEREEYLSIMLHSIGDAVIATDADGLITRMNPVAEKLTGWTFKKALGKTVNKIFPIIDASTRKTIENPIEKVMSNGETVYLSNHTTLISKDGKEYHIADSAAPIRDAKNNIQGMVLVFNDITEQYILRTQVSEQNRKLQRIFDGMQSIVAILDIDGTLTFINNTPLKLINLEQQDVLGSKLWNLSLFNYDTQTQQTIKSDCLKAATGAITFNDFELLTPEGLLWFEFSVHPVINEDGKVIQLVAEGRDINQRKQQEEILRRTQKMDAIGQLAGGIAHDFNNQLGVVIGYLDILQDSLEDKRQLKWISNSTRATLRCIDLTRQLLAFSRNKSADKSIVNINNLLQELKTMIARTVTPEVEVEYFLNENLWLTEIDCGEFQDAILNLVINARDAMPNGGKLVFETSNKSLDKDNANNRLNIDAGDYVQIIISDTGHGMDKQTLEHIFEPFFTTKSEDKGTGLGLAMVYGFVNRIGGSIRFYSETNIGTTIRMYLPRSTSSIISDNNYQKDILLPTGNENILIVDDEKDLLDLASKHLTDQGYHIQIAENANQALQILKQDSSIDLLFSDVVMPGGMNGYDLAEKVTQLWPDIKILLTSGFTSKAKNSNKPNRFDNNLLSKPYRKSELAKYIRLTLDKKDLKHS